ncbi:MAG: hypothetical protein ACI8YQ_000303 [Polaribacter sp.]|jgi:hypothetical protein
MLNVNIDGVPIPTPESSFAIPFYYYEKHLEAAGLQKSKTGRITRSK